MSTRTIVRKYLESGLRAAADETRATLQEWAAREANTSSDVLAPVNVPSRKGYEFGIPRGGTASATYQLGSLTGMSRKSQIEMLNDAYLACIPASACVDAIVKGVTAGGIVIAPNADVSEKAAPPPQVLALRRLLRFTNPRENILQLIRSTITDLLVSGDAFIEVSFLLGEPVAMYSLDVASMQVDSDEHGQVLSYTQRMGNQRDPVVFEPDEIIHISLDTPRGGLYGTSALLKCLLAMQIWLFTAADLQEQMRSGNPPRVHIDLPKDNGTAIETFYQKYVGRYLGAKGVTRPILTTRGGVVNELAGAKITDLLETLSHTRDQINSEMGTPPNKVQVVESGNLGGGTGEAQDKTWRKDQIEPMQALFLEAFNFIIVQEGFGITTHHVEFVEVDYRDSKVVEAIRDLRLRNGSWTLNRYRREIGEEPIEDGGDDAVIQVRTGLIYWKDMSAYTKAEMAALSAAAIAAGVNADYLLPGADMVPKLAAPDTKPPATPPEPKKGDGNEDEAIEPDFVEAAYTQHQPFRQQRSPDDEVAAIRASYNHHYQALRKKALKALPR